MGRVSRVGRVDKSKKGEGTFGYLLQMEDGGGIADGGIVLDHIFREPDRSFFGQSFQGENPPCIRNLRHVYAGKGAFRQVDGGFYPFA